MSPNVRSSNKEIDERLTPPRQMSLDQRIEYLRDDELLEVTPASLRFSMPAPAGARRSPPRRRWK